VQGEFSISFDETYRLNELIKDYRRACGNIFFTSKKLSDITELIRGDKVTDICLYNHGNTLKYSIFKSDIIKAISTLNKIIRNCKAVLEGINLLIKPQLSPAAKTNLDVLREELKGLKDKVELGVCSDIGESICEMEDGHYLATALIASRVIRYIIDQIPGRNDEEKLENLTRLNIINKKRKDEKKRFIHASRLSRNFLSHIAGLRQNLKNS